MSYCVKETLCTTCVHQNVCKWSNDYVDLQNILSNEEINGKPFCISVDCANYCGRQKTWDPDISA